MLGQIVWMWRLQQIVWYKHVTLLLRSFILGHIRNHETSHFIRMWSLSEWNCLFIAVDWFGCKSITESQTFKTSLYSNSKWIFLPFPGIKISPKCLSHFHTLSLGCSQLRHQCVVVIKTNERNYQTRLSFNVTRISSFHIFFPCFSFFFNPLRTSVSAGLSWSHTRWSQAKTCFMDSGQANRWHSSNANGTQVGECWIFQFNCVKFVFSINFPVNWLLSWV